MIKLGAEKHGGQNVHIPLDSISQSGSVTVEEDCDIYVCSMLGYILESST